MLLDLAELRLIDWLHIWKSVASRHLATRKFSHLADQVVFSTDRLRRRPTQLMTLEEEQPNSRFVDFEKTHAEDFHQIHAFITHCIIQVYFYTGLFVLMS